MLKIHTIKKEKYDESLFTKMIIHKSSAKSSRSLHKALNVGKVNRGKKNLEINKIEILFKNYHKEEIQGFKAM